MQILTTNTAIELASIKPTDLGRQALHSNEMTLRERQLLLLLDKSDTLSLQAVENLLKKVDITKFFTHGWVKHVSESDDAMPTTIVKASKADSKIQSFLSTYTAQLGLSTDTAQSIAPYAQVHDVSNDIASASLQPAIAQAQAIEAQPYAGEFEDIMIAQAMLQGA